MATNVQAIRKMTDEQLMDAEELEAVAQELNRPHSPELLAALQEELAYRVRGAEFIFSAGFRGTYV